MKFKISIPAQDDFWGRECNNPECKKYFKIHKVSINDEMFCPYCGLLFKNDELWTKDQLDYATAKAEEVAIEYVSKGFSNMLAKTFGKQTKSSKNSFIKTSINYKQGAPYRKKYIVPPLEKKVDSEIECSECKAKFQVYGIFGYCPLCKCDNVMIYDTNISIILNEINNSQDKNRALRHAYNDLVSTFEEFCKKRNSTHKKYNFQNLDSVDKFFKEVFNKNIFGELNNDEVLAIKKLFQKRHVYQHNKGIIDQKYIDIIPEDASLLNQIAPLDLKEFKKSVKIIRNILLNII